MHAPEIQIYRHTRPGRGRWGGGADRDASGTSIAPPLLLNGPAGCLRDPRVLPAAVAARLLPLVWRCGGLGFGAPWFALRVGESTPLPECSLAMRHRSGHAVARLTFDGWGTTRLGFLSPRLGGNGGVLTRDRREPGRRSRWRAARTVCPPGCLEFVLSGATPARLWEFHKRQATLHGAGEDPLPDDAAMVAFCDALEKAFFEWRLRGGLLAPLTPGEAERLRARAGAARERAARLGAAQSAQPETAWTRARLARVPPERVAARWIFGFCAAGLAATGLVPLTPLCMGAGAAAFWLHQAGRRRSRTLAALAGPLPGLAAGTGLAVWAATAPLTTTSTSAPEWAAPVSLLLLLPNFLLLLPLFPLDGARLLENTLFSRTACAWLKPASRLAAGLGVALLAWKMRSPVLGGVSFWIGASPLLTSGEAALVRRLRREATPPPPEGETIAPEKVAAAIRAVKQKYPRLRNAARISRIACRLCEAATLTPPSRRAACGLLALYGFGLLLPLAPLALFLQRNPTLEQWARLGNPPEERPNPPRQPKAEASNGGSSPAARPIPTPTPTPVRRALPVFGFRFPAPTPGNAPAPPGWLRDRGSSR